MYISGNKLMKASGILIFLVGDTDKYPNKTRVLLCKRLSGQCRDVYMFFFFIFIPWSALGAFFRVLGTCYGKETSRFCQAQNFEASFLCTAHFITSACSFNIGLALLLGIRSLDPRPRARTAPALA